jgi:hypothetical protein
MTKFGADTIATDHQMVELRSRRLGSVAAVPGSTTVFVVAIIAVVGIVALYNIAAPSLSGAGDGEQNQTGGNPSSHLVITNSSAYLVSTINSTTFTIKYYNCSAPNAPLIDSNEVIVNHTVMCWAGGGGQYLGGSYGSIDFMNGTVVYIHANTTGAALMGDGVYGYVTVVLTSGTRFIVNASGVIATLYPYQGREVFDNGTITMFPPCIYSATTNIEGSSASGNGTASFSYANGSTVKFYPNGTCSATGNG